MPGKEFPMTMTEFFDSLSGEQLIFLKKLAVNFYMDRDSSKEMEQLLTLFKLNIQEMNELLRCGSPMLINLFFKRNGINDR